MDRKDKDGGLTLTRYLVQDAPIYDKALPQGLLTEHLRSIVEQIQPATKRVTVAISVGDSVLRTAELPLMQVSEMRQMLKFNAKNYLQQDLRDYIFDCYIVPPRGPRAGRAGQGGRGEIQSVGRRGAKRLSDESGGGDQGRRAGGRSRDADLAGAGQRARDGAAGHVQQGNRRAGGLGLQDHEHQHSVRGRALPEPFGRDRRGTASRPDFRRRSASAMRRPKASRSGCRARSKRSFNP